jgi:hypothetical protein
MEAADYAPFPPTTIMFTGIGASHFSLVGPSYTHAAGFFFS